MPSPNDFFGDASWGNPAYDWFAITPSDSVNFAQGQTRAIYVGGAGNIACVSAKGSVVTFQAVPVGAVLQVMAVRVNATNTTATLLVGLQ